MTSRRRYALGALLLLVAFSFAFPIALGSVAAGGERDPSACERGELSVYPTDEEPLSSDTVAEYGELTDAQRAVFDRARTSDNRTVAADPATFEEMPDVVVYDGTRYRVSERTFGCPLVPGLPQVVNAVLLPLLALTGLVTGPLAPLVALAVAGLVWSEVNDWLQY